MGPVDADYGIGAAREHGRHQVVADIHDLDIVECEAHVFEDSLQECLIGRQPGDRDLLAREIGRCLDR
jgi:hypothetical protein